MIGAGPSGLSCAYQLARRGYKVTVSKVCPSRAACCATAFPCTVCRAKSLTAKSKILDLGVEFQLDTKIGKDVTWDELRKIRRDLCCHRRPPGQNLGIDGEDGPGIWTGTEFLNHVNSGKQVDIGGNVVVIGGGDTAIDAARVSKRVTIDSAACRSDGRRGHDPLPADPRRDAGHRARDRGGPRRGHQHRVPRGAAGDSA